MAIESNGKAVAVVTATKRDGVTATEADADCVVVIGADGVIRDPGAPVLAAGENHVGQVGTPGDVITLTATVEAAAYADGDIIFDATALANAVRVNGGKAIIQSISVVDKADQSFAFDLFVSPVTVDFGTVNSASGISDADAVLGVQRVCRFETADFIDLGGAKVATLKNVGLMVEADAASRSIFFAAISRGAPTFASTSDLVFRIGLIWF